MPLLQAGNKSKKPRKALTQKQAREYKLEKDIQKSITDWLDLTGWEYTVTDAALSVFKDESGKKHFRGRDKVAKSWPDLTINLPVSPDGVTLLGLMFVAEVKVPGAPYQPGQEAQLEN